MTEAKAKVPEIYGKIAEVLQKVGAVAKDQENKDQKFNFRGVDAVVNAVNPHLKEAGVFIAHEVLEHHAERFENANKKIVSDVRVKVAYTWYASDGSFVRNVAVGEGRDFADKGTAKAMSVAFRTHLIQLLALPTNDKDPDSENIEVEAPAVKNAAPVPPKPIADLSALKKEVTEQFALRGIVGEDAMTAAGDKYFAPRTGWINAKPALEKLLAALKAGEVIE